MAGAQAAGWNIQILSQPNPGPRPAGSPCSIAATIAPDDEVEVSPLVDVVPRLARRVDEDVRVLRILRTAALRLQRLQCRCHQTLELRRRPPRLGLEEAHLQ